MKRLSLAHLFILFVFGWLNACSTPPHPSDSTLSTASTESEVQRVDIRYHLGMNEHRLLAIKEGEHYEARSYVDQKLVIQNEIDSTRYNDFIDQTLDFTKILAEPKSGSNCRAPFSIKIRRANIEKIILGCRGEEHGGLSRLVHRGNFLLTSKK